MVTKSRRKNKDKTGSGIHVRKTESDEAKEEMEKAEAAESCGGTRTAKGGQRHRSNDTEREKARRRQGKRTATAGWAGGRRPT